MCPFLLKLCSRSQSQQPKRSCLHFLPLNLHPKPPQGIRGGLPHFAAMCDPSSRFYVSSQLSEILPQGCLVVLIRCAIWCSFNSIVGSLHSIIHEAITPVSAHGNNITPKRIRIHKQTLVYSYFRSEQHPLNQVLNRLWRVFFFFTSSWQASASRANVNLRERYHCTFIMKKFYMLNNINTGIGNVKATYELGSLLAYRVN